MTQSSRVYHMLGSHGIPGKQEAEVLSGGKGKGEEILSLFYFSSLDRTWHIWRSGTRAGPSSHCETWRGLAAGHSDFPPWPGLCSASSAVWRSSSGEPDNT